MESSSGRWPLPGLDKAAYPVARSDIVTPGPVPVQVANQRFVVWRRRTGEVVGMEDRCPHRNAPLSLGRVEGDRIACAYHGWAFGPEGACVHSPALDEPAPHAVPTVTCREREGLVWIGAGPLPPSFGTPTARLDQDFECPLELVAENILDATHTPFLHRGLFREPSRTPRTVEIRRERSRVTARYLDEPPPTGWLGRALGGLSADRVEHEDCFVSPCTTIVSYARGDVRLEIWSYLCPRTTEHTRLFGQAKLEGPEWLVRVAGRVVPPLAQRVLQQDARILAAQNRNVHAFGGPRFVHTEADVMAKHIRHLLSAAERGHLGGDREERVQVWL